MLELLATRIVALPAAHPLRVAVDGIDAAGKTTLADELEAPLRARGRSVIRASADGFQRPRAERYRRGSTSPDGYYEDAFDYQALLEALLVPLGPDGSLRYRRAVFDLRTDRPVVVAVELAPREAILVVDGVFLSRAELSALWDYRIFVEVPFDVALERALDRDVALVGSADVVRARYQERYFPAQRLYFERAHPRDLADAVVQNDHPSNPRVVFRDVA